MCTPLGDTAVKETDRRLVDIGGGSRWDGAGENQGLLIIYYVLGIMQRALHIFCLILTKWHHYPHFANQQTEAQGDEMIQPKSSKCAAMIQTHFCLTPDRQVGMSED